MTLFAEQELRESPVEPPDEEARRALRERFRSFVLSELAWVRWLDRTLAHQQHRGPEARDAEAQLQSLPVEEAGRRLLLTVLVSGSLEQASRLCCCSRLTLARRVRRLLQVVASSRIGPREPPLVTRLRELAVPLAQVAETGGAHEQG